MNKTDKKVYTFDQLICQRAKDEHQPALFAFPKSRLVVADYEFITGKKLHQLIDGAAKAFIQNDITSVVSTRTSLLPRLSFTRLTKSIR